MKPLNRILSSAVPLDHAHVNTDVIIPKAYLKTLDGSGLADGLFEVWRWHCNAQGQRIANPNFVLNQRPYKEARILLTRQNFGCGSSREHAVWALQAYGLQAIIAPSFGEIFYNNCFKNGLVAVILDERNVNKIFNDIAAHKKITVNIDIHQQTVCTSSHRQFQFDIEASYRRMLLEGWDDIDLTLEQTDKISQFEAQQRLSAPWLY